MKNILIILILSIFSLNADEMILDNYSYHISEKKIDYNNFNPGIGYKYELKDNYSILGGYYYNSFRKDTFYIGVEKMYDINEYFKAGIIGAFLTGYPYKIANSIDIIPAIGLDFEIDLNKKLKLNTLITSTQFLPETYMKTTVFHLQFRIPINY